MEQPIARRQSADRPPTRQQSINSIHGTASNNRRASVGSQNHVHTHVHQEEGPRPVQTPQGARRTRIGVPKAAFEKPRPAAPNGSIPTESRTAGDHVKDACAYCGLGYAGCSTLVTYPVTAAGCLGCGILGCLGGCCCIGGPVKGTYKGSDKGIKVGSVLASGVMCVPCIGKASARRLESSNKMSREGTRKTMKRLMPHYRGEKGGKFLDETFPRS
jgi:hypothetical protein